MQLKKFCLQNYYFFLYSSIHGYFCWVSFLFFNCSSHYEIITLCPWQIAVKNNLFFFVCRWHPPSMILFNSLIPGQKRREMPDGFTMPSRWAPHQGKDGQLFLAFPWSTQIVKYVTNGWAPFQPLMFVLLPESVNARFFAITQQLGRRQHGACEPRTNTSFTLFPNNGQCCASHSV